MKAMKSNLATIAMAALLGYSALAVATASAQEVEVEDAATGGGWILGTPSGESANFGFVGGITTAGDLFGHLNYVDQEEDLHVIGTGVVSYTVIDEDTRVIEYDVVIDGVAATAIVEVTDLGEPGWDDTFTITLSTGYSASGDLNGDDGGGGNIQVHTLELE